VKKFTLFVILTVFVLAACGAPAMPTTEPTLPPAPTNTLVPPPTETPIPPTATLEPSPTPTPVPLGGGGEFIMQINQVLIPKEFNSQESFRWFSASSDGSNLKMLDWQIWSMSPDGKLALTYTSDYKVSLTNLDGTGSTPLDDSLDYYINSNINSNFQTAIWLTNGNIVLLAFEQKQHNKISVYLVTADGKSKKWEKLSQVMKEFANLLFISPDGEKLYLETFCGNNRCNSQYYVASLDDSEQKQILINVKSFQNIYISPSGQYISYVDNSGQVLRGCFIYKVADDTATKLLPDDGLRGQDYCFGGNHWSPTDDKLFGQNIDGYSILTVLDGNITTFSEINAGFCYLARWTPNGKHLFLSVCTEKNFEGEGLSGGFSLDYEEFRQSIGERLINISDGKVTEYQDAGFCDAVISPDSAWVLFYACKNENKIVVYPSQLLNLDTKEMYPLFQEFIPENPDTLTQPQGFFQKAWSVFWIP